MEYQYRSFGILWGRFVSLPPFVYLGYSLYQDGLRYLFYSLGSNPTVFKLFQFWPLKALHLAPVSFQHVLFIVFFICFMEALPYFLILHVSFWLSVWLCHAFCPGCSSDKLCVGLSWTVPFTLWLFFLKQIYHKAFANRIVKIRWTKMNSIKLKSCFTAKRPTHLKAAN